MKMKTVYLFLFVALSQQFSNSLSFLVTKVAKPRLMMMVNQPLFSPAPSNFIIKEQIVKKSLFFTGMIGYLLKAENPVFAADEESTGSDNMNFVKTTSGLQYRDLLIGKGAVPLPGQQVSVHYTGWLEGFDSSKKFDSSYDRRKPLQFPVGTKRVIAGNSIKYY